MGKEAASQYMILREGLARIKVPNPDLYRRSDGVYEPAWAPVFYNPRMAHNRDIAVVFAQTYSSLHGYENLVIIEPLAGSGVRAIRYAVEAGAWVVVNDVDPKAVQLAQENIELNNVRERVFIANTDANELLSSLRRRGIAPSIIDLDPFGSPAPFIDAAIRAIRVHGVIAVTATDTAPLCGSHPKALRRRYDVIPARLLWEKEQAVRILAGYIIRRAASHEYGAKILLGYYRDYYVRLYIELTRGAGRADASLESLSFGVSCSYCGYVGYSEKHIHNRCPYCGATMQTAGPLYTGPLCDTTFLDRMIEVAEDIGEQLATQREAARFLKELRRECNITRPYYRIDRICSFHGLSMPSPRLVAEYLESQGYPSTRATFDPRGVKSTAPFSVLVEAIRRLAPG